MAHPVAVPPTTPAVAPGQLETPGEGVTGSVGLQLSSSPPIGVAAITAGVTAATVR